MNPRTVRAVIQLRPRQGIPRRDRGSGIDQRLRELGRVQPSADVRQIRSDRRTAPGDDVTGAAAAGTVEKSFSRSGVAGRWRIGRRRVQRSQVGDEPIEFGCSKRAEWRHPGGRAVGDDRLDLAIRHGADAIAAAQCRCAPAGSAGAVTRRAGLLEDRRTMVCGIGRALRLRAEGPAEAGHDVQAHRHRQTRA